MEEGLEPIVRTLVALGFPAAQAAELAPPLDRRARQLSEAKGRPYEEALLHLLRMMAAGWKAQEAAGASPGFPTGEAPP